MMSCGNLGSGTIDAGDTDLRNSDLLAQARGT